MIGVMASDPAASHYQDVPYESNPFPESHPARLATIAYLCGLDAPPVERCRVLELGCASGGNLLPAAEAFPGATFVGVDLAANQIADGRAVIDALGVENVRLEAVSFTDLPGDLGQFDYIIAHGLLAWIPAELQPRVLEAIKRHLSPRGVAYVSYNTYPGWRMRSILRDVLHYGIEKRGAADASPRDRLAAGRQFVEMILSGAGEDDTAYARVLRAEGGLVIKAPDYYIFHEHLEPAFAPLYFRDFAAMAAANGLQYLGEARLTKHEFKTADRLRTQHPELARSEDFVHFEQCVDFAMGRQFRRTLLVHADVSPIHRRMDASRLIRCQLAAGLFPDPPRVDARPGVSVQFRAGDGGMFSTADVGLKIALVTLAGSSPSALPFDKVWEPVRQALRLPAYPPQREALAETLLQLFQSDSLELFLSPPPLVRYVSPRPVASPLARWQAAHRRTVHNRRHRAVRILTEFDQAVLALLDGTRDLATLRSELGAEEAKVTESLQKLAVSGVLIG
jgi:SAM-dependent methyltransferase